MFAAGFSAVQPRETAKLKRMFQIPDIIEPGFWAIGLGVEPLFEVVAVNLVHVALWKRRRHLFQTPTEMAQVKPGTTRIGL